MPIGVNYTKPLHDCFAANRLLWENAIELATRVDPIADPERLTLRLGASAVKMGAETALAARDPREALRHWRDCDCADTQIRSATASALRLGAIGNYEFDVMFAVSQRALQARREEIQRLLHRLQMLMLI